MTELKTLKDILAFDNGAVYKEWLRQEAIKWAKMFNKGGKHYNNTLHFIQTFFNLTEDDLK